MTVEQDDLDDAREAVITGINKPSNVSTDAGSFTKQDPLQALDVIERVESRKSRANGAFAGIQVGKFVPPGAVSKNRDS